MKLKYLGTAAAEGIPALFCHCANCQRANQIGSKGIRTRSQALLDDRVLLDFPPDTYFHILRDRLDLSEIEALLITHVHSDHISPNEILLRKQGYAHLEGKRKMKIYGSRDLIPLLTPNSNEDADDPHSYTVIPMDPYIPFSVLDYTVTALPAVHGTEHPYLYLISREGKTLLYAHDTGYLSEDVWEYLTGADVHLSCVSLDCTFAMNLPKKRKKPNGHMAFLEDCAVRDRMIQCGIADPSTLFCLNHFSHNGAASVYSDLVPIAEKNGFQVSYDGFELNF